MTFADLGVPAHLVETLDALDIQEPFPIQALALPDALAGRDVCAKAQTGSGKTIVFALTLVQRLPASSGPRRPRGVVLVPTRELARQVFDVITPMADAVGLQVAAVYGGASFDKQIDAARRGVDVVVATPGRLIDLIERDVVHLDEIEIGVIDEADRMADMGFLPQVDWILRKVDPSAQMLLFSATLDSAVNGLVRDYLTDPVHHSVAGETTTVDEMTHRFFAVHEMDRVKVAASIARAVDRTIVFVRTKRGADRLADQLVREGVDAAPIHGDLRQSARERALRRFGEGKHAVLVATDVAARGIHVDDVDAVVQFDPPEDHKTYVHRAGRTARAGRSGAVATFVLWNQVADVERIKKRLGIDAEIVEVFSNDARLANLTKFAGG